MNVVLNYLKSDIVKNQRAFKIGFFTIFLVIFFTAMLMNTIFISPLIFLRLAENQAGEADIMILPLLNQLDMKNKVNSIDFLLSPNSSNQSNIIITNNSSNNFSEFLDQVGQQNFQFLNSTDLMKKLMKQDFIAGVVPRWIVPVNSSYSSGKLLKTNLIIINSRLENEFGFGRMMNLPPLGIDECYISDSLYSSLNIDLTSNSRIGITVNLEEIFLALSQTQSLTNSTPKANKTSGKYPKIDNSKDSKDSQSNKGNISKTPSLNFTTVFRQFIKSNPLLNNLSFEIITPQFLSDLSKNGITSVSVNSLFNSNSGLNLNSIVTSFLEQNFGNGNSIANGVTYQKSNNSININSNFVNLSNPIKFNITDFLLNLTDEDLNRIIATIFTFNIRAVVSNSDGKWPSILGNAIAIDSSFANTYIVNGVSQIINNIFSNNAINGFRPSSFINSVQDLIGNFSLDEYALTVNVLLKNKFDIYSQSSSKIQSDLSDISKKIVNLIGIDSQVFMINTLYLVYNSISVVRIFLENIFNSVIVFLVILSTVLIYSLMIGNVDERTYEFGILRAVGYKKSHLLYLILSQSLLFSIPAIILALITGYIINIVISRILFNFSGFGMSYSLFPGTVIWAIFSGLLIPIISSYVPIKNALSENLKEALTIFNKKISDITVQVMKLEKLGVSPASVLSSILLIFMGFITYYLAPLAFFMNNLTMFLFILNLILIIMIIGMIFMLQMIVPYLEKLILYILMIICYPDRNIKFIIYKNLDSHAPRNQKTSIMFMISLSFIIFSGSTITLISNFIVNVSRNAFGSQLSLNQNDPRGTLDEIGLTNYLNNFNKRYPGSIRNFSFATFPLSYYINNQSTYLSNLIQYPNKKIDIVGVSPSLVESVYSDIYAYKELNDNIDYNYLPGSNEVDVISTLYKSSKYKSILNNITNNNFTYPIPDNKTDFMQNSINLNGNEVFMIIPEGLRNTLALNTKVPAFIKINGNYNHGYIAKIISMQSKLAGFLFFSSYPALANFSPVLISLPQLREIVLNEYYFQPNIQSQVETQKNLKMTFDNITKQQLFIKFSSDLDSDLKDLIIKEIQSFVDDTTDVTSIDTFINAANQSSSMLQIFYIVIGLVALILAFFLIWISFYSNIRDNIVEYGIMRSIGLTKKQSLKVYLYEAVVLILGSIIVGTGIGLVVSSTLVLQFNLFIEFPFQMIFPYALYLTLCLIGFGLSLLGSYYPTSVINDLPLVKILKGYSE